MVESISFSYDTKYVSGMILWQLDFKYHKARNSRLEKIVALNFCSLLSWIFNLSHNFCPMLMIT